MLHFPRSQAPGAYPCLLLCFHSIPPTVNIQILPLFLSEELWNPSFTALRHDGLAQGPADAGIVTLAPFPTQSEHCGRSRPQGLE